MEEQAKQDIEEHVQQQEGQEHLGEILFCFVLFCFVLFCFVLFCLFCLFFWYHEGGCYYCACPIN